MQTAIREALLEEVLVNAIARLCKSLLTTLVCSLVFPYVSTFSIHVVSEPVLEALEIYALASLPIFDVG